MIELFFCLVLHTECSILVSKASNEIKNSTTQFESVVLHSSDTSPFFIVTSSNITLSRTGIVTSVPVISSNAGSSIILSSISLANPPSSLVHSTSDTITLEHTSIANLAIPQTEGTFLSSGYASIQKVLDCNFLNLSRGVEYKRNNEERFALADKGFLQNSLFERSEDTFYGFVITGPTVKTLSSFDCFNSTFARCTRIHNPPSRLPPSLHRRVTSATCTTSQTSDCELTTGNLRPTTSTTFTRATFTDCTSTSVGGALFLNQESVQLTLVTCSFTTCTAAYSSNDGGGGAVEVDRGSLSASSSNFTSCSSKTYGGAIYLYYPSTGISITSCIFCENTATKDAPDVCFYQSSTPSNPFSSCVTYNPTKTYTSGYYYNSYSQQTGWLQSSGTTCPSNSGGGGGGEEDGDDIDDVMIDDCPSDDGDPTPGKTLYVSTDGAETSNCGKNRESDPMCCYYSNLTDCYSITNGCPGSYYDYSLRKYYTHNYTSDSGFCISISKAIGSNESSASDWNKVILMESSEGAHQSDTAAIAVAAKKVWITGENDGVIFKLALSPNHHHQQLATTS